MSKYTEEEILLSHRGRQLSEQENLSGDYCGTCSIEIHRGQLDDPDSWVQHFVQRWIDKAKDKLKPCKDEQIKKLKAERTKLLNINAILAESQLKTAQTARVDVKKIGAYIENEMLKKGYGGQDVAVKGLALHLLALLDATPKEELIMGVDLVSGKDSGCKITSHMDGKTLVIDDVEFLGPKKDSND